MNTKLNVVAFQISLFWENSLKNRSLIDNQLRKIDDQADIVLLPEMFTTGFTMKAKEVAEEMDGPTIRWMQECAKKLDILILSLIHI